MEGMDKFLKMAEGNPFSSLVPFRRVHCEKRKLMSLDTLKPAVPTRNIAAAAASGDLSLIVRLLLMFSLSETAH